MPSPLVVLDTMIIARALFDSRNSPEYRVVSAIETGEVRIAVSDDSLSELSRVVRYGDIREKMTSPVLALEIGLCIGVMGYFCTPERHEWPSMRDSKDWWVLDLALDSGADYIVTDDNHFSEVDELGFEAITPSQLLEEIHDEEAD